MKRLQTQANKTKQAIDNIESEVKMSRRDSVSTASSKETVEEAVVKIEQLMNMNVKPQGRDVMEMVRHGTEERGMPIRYPASAFFNINSIDRYASAQYPTAQFALLAPPLVVNQNPASSYNMSSTRNMLSGYFHRLCVTEANLQWNVPTINSQNYIFCMSSIDSSGTTTTANVVLRQDYYTFTELAKEIEDSVRAALSLPTFTAIWSDTANGSGYQYIFSSGNATTLYFNDTLANSAPTDIISGTTINDATRAMYKFYTMIGINGSWIGSTQASSVLIATPTYPTLIYTSYVDIISNKLSQFMRVKDSETSWSADTSVIARIYLTNQGAITAPVTTQIDSSGVIGTTFDTFAVGSRPFILNYTPNTPKYIKWEPGQAIIDFDIRVIDEFGDQVPWSLYTPFSVPGTTQTYFTEFFEFQLSVLASET